MSEMEKENVLENLYVLINETKLLVEKVMKMRMECMNSQLEMLRLFNPECVRILEMTNELSGLHKPKALNDSKKIKIKQSHLMNNESIRKQE